MNKVHHFYQGRPLQDACKEMGISYTYIRKLAREQKISSDEAVKLYLNMKKHRAKITMYDENTTLFKKCKELGIAQESIKFLKSKNKDLSYKELVNLYLKKMKDK